MTQPAGPSFTSSEARGPLRDAAGLSGLECGLKLDSRGQSHLCPPARRAWIVGLLAMGGLVCFGVSRGIAGEEAGIGHHAASYFMGNNPVAIHALAELPPPLPQKVEEHLRARLGDEFYARLKFCGGRRRDPADDAAATDPRVVVYELDFSFSRPEDGIAEYVALLPLGADGSVLTEIDLPSFGKSPDAHRFVPLAKARELAARSGFSGTGIQVDLDYSPEQDCLRWRFARSMGLESGRFHYRNLDVLMEDHPVVEIHDTYAIP